MAASRFAGVRLGFGCRFNAPAYTGTARPSYRDQASNIAVNTNPRYRDVTVGRGRNRSVSRAVADSATSAQWYATLGCARSRPGRANSQNRTSRFFMLSFNPGYLFIKELNGFRHCLDGTLTSVVSANEHARLGRAEPVLKQGIPARV
jgi:hypothetical protein